MKVLVYVEGPSDRDGLAALLRPIIEAGRGKRVVEDLFNRYRKKPGYVDTTDAPWILERASLDAVEQACPQRFAPFVADLRAAIAERTG